MAGLIAAIIGWAYDPTPYRPAYDVIKAVERFFS